jgi:hypothetical protein
MCKLNSAAYDRIIMPHCPRQAAFSEWVAELPMCLSYSYKAVVTIGRL